ncbi:MAG TPA: RsiV family protein [Pyrinomonadaceae bacterium]
MSAPLKALVALAAAAACACAQGCAGPDGTPQVARVTPVSAQPSSASAATSPANVATPTPPPYAPPFPALERGTDAFEPHVSLSGGRRLESREVGRKPSRKDLKVEADYPVLLGDERPAAREFNRRVRSLVLDEVTPSLEAGRDPEKEKHPHWKDVEEYHNVSHKVVYASDELVSVFFYVEGYSWGAAHGYHRPVTFDFDLKAGRELQLARLFKPGSGYLRRLAELCGEDLRRQFGADFAFFTDGLKPEAKNFDSWVVTRDGLVFIFEEYQLVAYAQGEPKVLIPFDRLKEMINPRGALAGVAANQ